MARLTTVTFDLWETLILDSPEAGRPRSELRLASAVEILRHEGFPVTLGDVQEGYRRCEAACKEVRDAGRDLSFDEQIDIFLRCVDETLPKRISAPGRLELAQRYADCYLRYPPKIDPHAQIVLRSVRDMGFKLGMICNTGATPGFTQRVFLEQAGLANYFQTLTFSDEERAAKPSARIFQSTLERLGAQPSEAVHIGDHPRNDVLGAKQAGLRTIWLRRDSKLALDAAADATIASLMEVLVVIPRLANEGRETARLP